MSTTLISFSFGALSFSLLDRSFRVEGFFIKCGVKIDFVSMVLLTSCTKETLCERHVFFLFWFFCCCTVDMIPNFLPF